MSSTYTVRNGSHAVSLVRLHYLSFLAMEDHIHPLTTVIVWTPTNASHRWCEREDVAVGRWSLISATLSGLDITVALNIF